MVYTFSGIKTEIETRLSLLSNWQKTLWSGVYANLTDAIAYAIDKRCLYPAEVYFRESNISTATQYPFVIPYADMLGYTAARKIGSNGTIQLSADPYFSSSYVYAGNTTVIPRWNEFTDSTGAVNVYCTTQSVYYAVTSGNLDIPVKEGIPKEFLYIATGIPDEVLTLYSDSIDNDEIDVYIVDVNNEILYTILKCGIDVDERKLFYINDLTEYYCQIENNYDFESIKITFGNGINTLSLYAGARVLIKYADTKGDLGDISAISTISKIKTALYDSTGTAVTLYVTNQAAISNGADIETIESIKYNAINLFQTGYRCGGYTDWIEVLQAHPLISRAVIWSTDDVADDTLTTLQNKIFVTAINNTGAALTAVEQDDITINYLKDKKSPCELVSWQTLNIIYAVFRVDAVVETLSFPSIAVQLNDSLDLAYSILNTDFKTNIYESNFTSLIDNNAYVVHHNTDIYNLEKRFYFTKSNYTLATSVLAADESDLTKQCYVQPNTLEIWVRSTETTPTTPLTASPQCVATDVSGTITAHNNTYVDLLLGSSMLGTTATGLANNTTVYSAHIHVTGGGPVPIDITGNTAQTITDLVSEINTQITTSDGLATFSDGDDYLRIAVTTAGASTITFTDTNLVSSLFGGAVATAGTPVNGYKYTIAAQNINYTSNNISYTISDAVFPTLSYLTQYEICLLYKTKDGEGGQTNDLRLPAFNYITSTDSNYNTFDMSY